MAATVYSNKYEVQEEIARGGMGIVYKAWDRMLERVVALKVIHQNLANGPGFLARFLDEARKMALLHHPNIIQIYSVEKDQDMPFLVMEYFPGANLKTHLHQKDPLELRASVNIVSQIAHALAFTHRKGIIHRDIKPANILLDNTLTVKLTDFGIARAFGQTAHTATGQLLGTVKYMSPEQAQDIPLDGRSDLYSLGMLFYELVTGTNPRNDLTAVGILSMLITEGHIPSLSFPARLNIPHEIQQSIIDLLQFHPTDRIPNAETLIERLEKSFPRRSTSRPTFEAENTNETITLNEGHILKGLANEPSVSQSSASLLHSTSLSQTTDGVPALDHKDSFASLQNLPAIQPEETLKSESPPQEFSWSRSGLLVITIFLILVIGGYAWNYWNSQPALRRIDNPIASKPNIKNFEEEKSTLLLSDSNSKIQQEKVIPSEELNAQMKKPRTSLASPKLPQAKTSLDLSRPTLTTQNPTKDKSSPEPIVAEANSSKSPQLARSTPPTSNTLPAEIPHQALEGHVESKPLIVPSPQVQSEVSPTSTQISIPPIIPSSDLTPSEVLPIVQAKPALPTENIEEGQGTVAAITSQEIISSNLHFQVEQLQQAIIEKNWVALERISSMSQSRRSWLETLYTKYQSVQIDIAQVATEANEGKAIIHFTKGIRSNGEIVIPDKIGRTIKITIPKNGDQWGRIIW